MLVIFNSDYKTWESQYMYIRYNNNMHRKHRGRAFVPCLEVKVPGSVPCRVILQIFKLVVEVLLTYAPTYKLYFDTQKVVGRIMCPDGISYGCACRVTFQ